MNILEYGIEQGREQGIMLKMVELVQKKISKGMGVMEIAEILEADPELIKTISNLINDHPNADIKDIYQLLNVLI